jgi:hypothetical protein
MSGSRQIIYCILYLRRWEHVRNAYKLTIRKLKGRIYLEDPDIDDREIFNKILKTRDMRM